jgi:hypothetical protein
MPSAKTEKKSVKGGPIRSVENRRTPILNQ